MMHPEVVDSERRYACSDELIIRNAPLVEYGPYMFQPTRLSIKWARVEGRVWRPLAIILEGPHVTEEGRLSRYEKHNRSFEPDTAPEWARDIAASRIPPTSF